MGERLARADWQHFTHGLLNGQRQRFPHFCGPGSPLLVSAEGGGFRAWCFRCAVGDEMRAPEPSLAEKLARLRAAGEGDAGLQRHESLPETLSAGDMVQWPPAARLWLYRAGVGPAEAAMLGAGFHPPSGRVVLPVNAPGYPPYWQARSIDRRVPKYLGPSTGRATALPRWGDYPVIAVTEDILSAFKIGLSGCEGWCALGTRLSARFIGELLKTGKRALVWLDPDKAGQAGAQKILKQLAAYEVPATNIVSEKDPKLHTKEYIRGRIEAELAAG